MSPDAPAARIAVAALGIWLTTQGASQAKPIPNTPEIVFSEYVEPILFSYGYEFHGYGADVAGATLDQFASAADAVADRELC